LLEIGDITRDDREPAPVGHDGSSGFSEADSWRTTPDKES